MELELRSGQIFAEAQFLLADLNHQADATITADQVCRSQRANSISCVGVGHSD
jgi:hypothetical protein